jgi:hypothetical protein
VALAVADFNRDGRPDLAIADQGTHAATVLLGLGDGTFLALPDLPAGQKPTALAAADFNGDGLPDLAVADAASGDVLVFFGRGDGTFQPATRVHTGGLGPRAIVATDLDGDTLPDLVVLDADSNNVAVLRAHWNQTFDPARLFAVGQQPVALVVGDFNGDGRPDLAAANAGSKDVSVLLNQGGDRFAPAAQSPVALSGTPAALAVTDLNGDGKPDLVVSEPASFTLSTLLGDGGGKFRPEKLTPNAGAVSALVPIDLTGDGVPDLVTANSSFDFLFLYFSSGAAQDGTLFPAVNSMKPFRATPLLADLTGDGTPDAVIVTRAGAILFREGAAGPGKPLTYASPVPVNRGGAPALAVTVVSNKGGSPLLAAVDATADRVQLYRRAADGSWQNAGQLDTQVVPSAIASADLNGDGRGDLVVSNLESSTVQVFLAGADGAFHAAGDPVRTGFDASDVLLDDVNGDKVPDVLAVNGSSGDVAVLFNDGTGSLGAPLRFRAGAGPYFSTFRVAEFFGAPGVGSADQSGQAVAADFDGDGTPDLAVINGGSHTFSVLTGHGPGNFANPQVTELDGSPLAAVAGPFKPGGAQNLIILEQKSDNTYALAVFRGDGRGGFVRLADQPDLLATVNLPSGLTFADVDGDGTPDLLVGNEFGDVLTLLGQGDGTFRLYQAPGPHISLAVADADRFVIGNQGGNRVSVRDADGQQLFTQGQAAGIKAPGAVRTADVGGGVQALVVANSGANNVRVYLGGGGLFDPATARDYPAGDDPAGLTVTDVNGDGIPDVLVADQGSNDVAVLLGRGRGRDWTLEPGSRLQVNGRGPVSVTVADVTGLTAAGTATGRADGIPDLVVANSQSNSVSVLPGVGGGFFTDQGPVRFATGTSPQQVLVGDFTGDGQADLVSVNAGSNDLTFFSHPDFASSDNVGLDISSGGLTPVAAVAFGRDGKEGLIVANNGDGTLALLTGDAGGLVLSKLLNDRLHPTDLALAELSGQAVDVYVANEGRESVERLSFGLDFFGLSGPPLPDRGEGAEAHIVLLLPGPESSLSVLATLLPGDGGGRVAGPGPADADTTGALPAPGFLLGLHAAPGNSPADRPELGRADAAAMLRAVLAAVEGVLREGWPGLDDAVKEYIPELAGPWSSAVRQIASVRVAVPTPAGWREVALPSSAWRRLVDDVGQALLRAARSAVRPLNQRLPGSPHGTNARPGTEEPRAVRPPGADERIVITGSDMTAEDSAGRAYGEESTHTSAVPLPRHQDFGEGTEGLKGFLLVVVAVPMTACRRRRSAAFRRLARF